MSKNAITVIDQERIDLFKELAAKALDENEYCITLNLNVFNDFISDHEALIEINAELTKRDIGATQALKVWADKYEKLQAENAELKNKLNEVNIYSLQA